MILEHPNEENHGNHDEEVESEESFLPDPKQEG
jgi:hypothetical protein